MKEFVKKNKILVGAMVFVFVGIIAIAYAAFTQGLNINGSGVNRKSNFDIHFANLSSPTIVGTANVATAPTIQNNSTVIEDYSITLATPKDSVSYTFDIVNDGDYDATLKGLTVGPVKCSVNGNESDQSAVNVCQNIEYTLKYADGSTLQTNNDKLLSKETKQLKLTLTYKEFNDATKLPTNNVSISNLGIELVYEADTTAKANSDGSTPYVDPYDYHVGDTFTISGDQYYVIADSERTSDYVTALKATPLTVAEVNTYGTGHVNMHNNAGETAYNANGYGGMAYYTSTTCGYVNGSWVSDGCKTNYAESEIKYVVDAWAADKFKNDELKKVDNYKARLISFDDLTNNLGYSLGQVNPSTMGYVKSEFTPNWSYNLNYWYWTMSQYQDSSSLVWGVFSDGGLSNRNVYSNYSGSYGAVRPVINLYKSKL